MDVNEEDILTIGGFIVGPCIKHNDIGKNYRIHTKDNNIIELKPFVTLTRYKLYDADYEEYGFNPDEKYEFLIYEKKDDDKLETLGVNHFSFKAGPFYDLGIFIRLL